MNEFVERFKKRFWVVIIVFVLFCPSAFAQTCGPDPAPAPAVAHGLTCEVFWDDFTSSSTVDLNNTGNPGFKWYLQKCCGATGPTNPADITFVPGGMQLIPSSNDSMKDLYNMGSCFIGSGGTLVGNAISGSMYVEITITYIEDFGAFSWWPALWALGKYQLGAGPRPAYPWDSPEIDYIEHLGGGRNLHYWHMTPSGQTDHYRAYGDITPGLLHSIGTLTLSPADNGGTGLAAGFVNGAPDNGPPFTWALSDPHDVVTTVPLCFLITTAWKNNLTLRSWKVFQAPPSNAPQPLWFTSP